MVYKITPKELQGRKDDYLIVDVREADELVEEGNPLITRFLLFLNYIVILQHIHISIMFD
jgi:hypothetical protein